MAVPTTLSGAEMTSGHRHATGVDDATPRVRPAVVVFDPALAASQPIPELAASSLNALGHAVEGPCTVRANPVATLAAHEAARLIAAGWSTDEPDREALALGALLAGYVIDSTGLGLHHVVAQSLVRAAGAGHGPANAAVLPHTIGALATPHPAGDRRARRRRPRRADSRRPRPTTRRRPRRASSPSRGTSASAPARRACARSASTPPTSARPPTPPPRARNSPTPRPRDPRRDPRALPSGAMSRRSGRSRGCRAAGRRGRRRLARARC